MILGRVEQTGSRSCRQQMSHPVINPCVDILNNSANLGNLPVDEGSQVGMRHPAFSSIEEEQSGILPRGPRSQLDQPTTANAERQGLSLCLFPKYQSTVELPPIQNYPRWI